MTILVLVLLAAVWAAVLLPPWLQERRSAHPASSVVDFRQSLQVLDRAGRPTPPGAPRRPAMRSGMSLVEARRRRRDVLTTLVAAAALTLAIALAFGGSVWMLHLAIDTALLGYVAMLMQVQQPARPAQANVRYLPARHTEDPRAEQLLLRRAR